MPLAASGHVQDHGRQRAAFITTHPDREVFGIGWEHRAVRAFTLPVDHRPESGDGLQWAEQILEDVRVVHAHIDGDTAGAFQMPPGGDDDVLTRPGGRLHDQERPSQHPGIDQGFRQPVDRIAPVVFGHREHPVPLRRQQLASFGDGEGDRLFHLHMPPGPQRLDPDACVQIRRGGDIERSHLGGQIGGIGIGGWTRAQQLLGQIGHRVCARVDRVANGHQVEAQPADLLQFLQAEHMPASHDAASGDCEGDAHEAGSSSE